MAYLSYWHVGSGALTVTVRPLAPFVLYPSLELVSISEKQNFPFTTAGGSFSTELSDADVAKLILAPDTAQAPFLLLNVRAVFAPGAPNRVWRWGIRLSRAGESLPCFDANGIEVLRDAEGFVRAPRHVFPAGKNYGSEEWDIILTEGA